MYRIGALQSRHRRVCVFQRLRCGRGYVGLLSAGPLFGPRAALHEEAERMPSTFISLLKGWDDVQTKSAAVLMQAS